MDKSIDLITLPVKIKSLNEMYKAHWAVKKRLKQEYALLIRNQMNINKIRKISEPEKVSLYILSFRKRKIDYDNLVGGCKHLIDALCDEGFLYDDSPKFIIKLIVEQMKSKTEYTLIKRIA
jgi:Holliday junction resolvase RusA-like endonuclease